LNIFLDFFYFVHFFVDMHVDSCTTYIRGELYKRDLLRTSRRENGKVVHETLLNLNKYCTKEEIQALKLAFKYKHNLQALCSLTEDLEVQQGLSFGAVWLIHDIARRLGIIDALGKTRDGKLALWQVIARVIDQGSRLSAVRLAGRHAACDILALDAFHEDHLYANLDWLAENQAKIENRLFRKLHAEQPPQLFLYDVTSTYLEGTQNELASFGYNREGKRGKLQLVIGLLCNEFGQPLSIEVFRGNTADPKTVASQVRKVAERFGGGEVTFVGDRGMLKSEQIHDILDNGFHYITAITKPQIESLLRDCTVAMSLFDQKLSEVTDENGIRYIMRRNPIRAKEIQESREKKLNTLRNRVESLNTYLSEHRRAVVEVALRKVSEYCAKLKLDSFVTVSSTGRAIAVDIDEEALVEFSKLDGCYVITTDLPSTIASKETVHDRYKDLTFVEKAFREMKTVELELRPVNVRLASRTRGHVFVVMLAYRITQELSKRWESLNIEVSEGIDELTSLCTTVIRVKSIVLHKIPKPRELSATLLELADVDLPEFFPHRNVNVATRKNIAKRR